MALPLPETMSPSKVSGFGDCALAFRLRNIDKLPEEPSVAAVRGTLVHLALQHLLDRPAPERTRDNADLDFDRAITEMADDPEILALDLDPAATEAFNTEARRLLHRYFEIEDPTAITPIGLEIMLETNLDGLRLRGIIDRLELDADGGLVVTDYKTGRSPAPAYAQARLIGVHIYALLCLETLGVLPSTLRLVYLGDGAVITAEPSEQSIRAIRRRIDAVWNAVERACETENFKPRPGPLCNWCSFHEFCPAQGGSLDNIAAALERPALAEADAAVNATAAPATAEAGAGAGGDGDDETGAATAVGGITGPRGSDGAQDDVTAAAGSAGAPTNETGSDTPAGF